MHTTTQMAMLYELSNKSFSGHKLFEKLEKGVLKMSLEWTSGQE